MSISAFKSNSYPGKFGFIVSNNRIIFMITRYPELYRLTSTTLRLVDNEITASFGLYNVSPFPTKEIIKDIIGCLEENGFKCRNTLHQA